MVIRISPLFPHERQGAPRRQGLRTTVVMQYTSCGQIIMYYSSYDWSNNRSNDWSNNRSNDWSPRMCNCCNAIVTIALESTLSLSLSL